MWNLTLLPKTVFFYWGGKNLPFLRYTTITSFIRQNPDWKVKFYYPKHPSLNHSWESFEQKYTDKWDNYFDKVFKLGIETVAVDFEDLGVSNEMSEVHKSDLLRWKLLSEGGLWADMDILFFAPMDNLLINNKDNEDADTVVSVCKYGHSIGFLMGSDGNEYFSNIFKQALIDYIPTQYQCIGSTLLNRMYPRLYEEDGVLNVGMSAVYYYDAHNMGKIYEQGQSPKDVAGAIGCHWYAGCRQAGDFLLKTNGGKDKLPNTVLGNLIKEYGSSKV
jgi:hypothetical protein